MPKTSRHAGATNAVPTEHPHANTAQATGAPAYTIAACPSRAELLAAKERLALADRHSAEQSTGQSADDNRLIRTYESDAKRGRAHSAHRSAYLAARERQATISQNGARQAAVSAAADLALVARYTHFYDEGGAGLARYEDAVAREDTKYATSNDLSVIGDYKRYRAATVGDPR